MPIQLPPKLRIEVLTPEVTEKMNENVKEGKALPYTYFSFNEQDYLTMGQWLQDVLRYVRESNEQLKYYKEKAYKNGQQSKTTSDR